MSRSWSNEPGQRHTCFDVVCCEIKIQKTGGLVRLVL